MNSRSIGEEVNATGMIMIAQSIGSADCLDRRATLFDCLSPPVQSAAKLRA